MAMLDAHEHPSKTSCAGFDDIPRVEGIGQSFDSHGTTLVMGRVGGIYSVDAVCGTVLETVRFPGVGEYVQEGEK
jgi:hypothetical protein